MFAVTLTVAYDRHGRRSSADADSCLTASIPFANFVGQLAVGAFRFDLSSLPARGLVFDNVELRIDAIIDALSGIVDYTAMLYDADGQADPETPSCTDFITAGLHQLSTFPPTLGTNSSPIFGSGELRLPNGIKTIVCDPDIAGPLIAQARYDVGRVTLCLGGPTGPALTAGSGVALANVTELLLTYHQVDAPVETGRRKHRARITDQFGAAKGQVLP